MTSSTSPACRGSTLPAARTSGILTDDAIPRITWGKYVRQDDRETLGLSIEVNHRFVDGVHLGRFYEALQQKINDLE